jgi:hypothetical protein
MVIYLASLFKEYGSFEMCRNKRIRFTFIHRGHVIVTKCRAVYIDTKWSRCLADGRQNTMRSPKKRRNTDDISHYWCSVPGCRADGRKKARLENYPWMKGVQFKPKLRRQWLQQVFRDENYVPRRYHSVCSLHFVDGVQLRRIPSLHYSLGTIT